jgi:fructosamine-3-kinase
MVTVSSGVNELELDIAGQSFATVRHQLKTVLNLDGNETPKLNGGNVPTDYILKDGDKVEFVKASGSKGAVEVSSGVNNMSLDLGGKTVGQVRTQLSSVLGIDSSYKVEVNGSSQNDTYTLKDGDSLEFVKQSGSKGMSVEVTSGVNEMSLDLAGKTVSEVRNQLSSVLGIDSSYTAKVNGSETNDSYTLEDGDELEFVKASGSKGVQSITLVV